MDIFTFEKTPVARLNEFLDILKFNSDSLPASKIRSEWACYLEFELEPSGWQAIWKMPRELCEDFKIHYPNLVLVTIKDICYKLLIANVNIIGVQDDNIHLPETLEAELAELWPTKKQQYDTLDMVRTADCLDKFRFFYDNIWMPWDMYLDENVDWISEHLKPRLDLYYALRTGVIREPKCAYIKGLIKEAKSLQTIKNNLEDELSDDEEVAEDPQHAKRLLKIHLRMKQLQEQVQICENQQMRDLLEISGLSDSSFESCTNSEIYFVSQKCTVNEHLKYVAKSQEFIPDESLVQYTHNLESVLDVCGDSDGIILSPGVYVIQSLIKIKDNCSLKGLYSPEETKLETLVENSYFISTYGKVVLENMTINAQRLQFAFIVAFGELHLKNCVLLGDGSSITKHGISVSPNCSIEVENCVISDFSTGIICTKGTKIVIRDSVIRDCIWGLQIFSTSNVQLLNTTIRNCKEYGINVIDDEHIATKGDSNIIESMDNINIGTSTIENCKISNIAIHKSTPDYDLLESKTQDIVENMPLEN